MKSIGSQNIPAPPFYYINLELFIVIYNHIIFNGFSIRNKNVDKISVAIKYSDMLFILYHFFSIFNNNVIYL